MEFHMATLARKVLDMDEILQSIKNHKIIDYDFIMQEELVLEQQNLGIPLKMLKLVYKEAVINFNSTRNNNEDQNQFDSSLIIVMINPDNHTALNYRKKQLLDSKFEVEREIELTNLILRKHPSKPILLYHLYYIYKHFNVKILDFNDTLDLVCQKYKCNYSGWRYKREILPEVDINLELMKNMKFVQQNLSDCSGWSFRQYVIRCIVSGSLYGGNSSDGTSLNTISGLKSSELKFIQDLLDCFGQMPLILKHRTFFNSLI